MVRQASAKRRRESQICAARAVGRRSKRKENRFDFWIIIFDEMAQFLAKKDIIITLEYVFNCAQGPLDV